MKPSDGRQAVLEFVETDEMHVVEPRAAGLDVHKLQVTATVRLCEPGGGLPLAATRQFSALPGGLRQLTAWLQGHGVTAAAMEGTGGVLAGPVRGSGGGRHPALPAARAARQADQGPQDRQER